MAATIQKKMGEEREADTSWNNKKGEPSVHPLVLAEPALHRPLSSAPEVIRPNRRKIAEDAGKKKCAAASKGASHSWRRG